MEIQSGWNQQRRLFPGVLGGHVSRVSGAIVGQIFLSYGGGRNGLEPGSISMSVEEWMSVLKLSTLWAIEDIRNNAIAELSKAKMDVMDRVTIGKSYGVGDWLLEG